MDASKPLFEQIKELKKNWVTLWWNMSEGKQSDYERIKAMDIMEFWPVFDLYCAKIEREKEFYKTRKKLK